MSPGVPSTFGSLSRSAPSSERSLLTSAPAFMRSGRTVPPRAVEHRQHHMRGLDDLVVAAQRERLRIGQRRLKLAVSLSCRI